MPSPPSPPPAPLPGGTGAGADAAAASAAAVVVDVAGDNSICVVDCTMSTPLLTDGIVGTPPTLFAATINEPGGRPDRSVTGTGGRGNHLVDTCKFRCKAG